MKNVIFLFLFFAFAKTVSSQVVSTNAELDTAISNASAGTTITLADGVWTNVDVTINKNGTAANPVVITAQTPGSVFIEGNSHIELRGDFVVLTGVVFQNASVTSSGGSIDPAIRLNACDDCIVTNIKIDAYNGTLAQSQDTFKWILLDGQRNEISYNSFIGKNGVGSIINDNRNSVGEDYTKIHHNYFANRTPVGGTVNTFNDQDAIRIGNSSTSLSDSFTEVYENYFYNFFGEVEIISNKSGKNKYYNNTFRDYAGSLTLRHGNNCEVYGNFFFAENNNFTAGVRVIGEGHNIYNNYIEGINSRKQDGGLSNATGGINVSNGRVNTALNGYYQVKDATIVNNTFVNCDYALRVGTKVKSDLSLAPSNVILSNNIFLNTTDNAYQEVTAPIDGSSTEANITQNGSWDLTNGTNQNITVGSGLLSAGSNFYELPTGSDAIDYSVGSFPFLTNDILGGSRPNSNFDAGAEEFGANGTRIPFIASDVGLNIGFGAQPYGGTSDNLATSTNLITFFKNESTNIFNIVSNVSWDITNTSSWIIVTPTSGTGNSSISVSVLENTTGSTRMEDITVSQVGGALTETVTITQTTLDFDPNNALEIVPVNVSGQGTQAPNNPENVLDNDDGTRWSGDSSMGDAFLTFDLGCDQLVTGVKMKFFKGNERTSSFKVLTSNDNVNFTDATAILTSSGVTLDYEQFDFPTPFLNTRYFRIQGLGNSGPVPNNVFNSYVEVEIIGNPIDCNVLSTQDNNLDTITIYPVPVTRNKLVIKSSSFVINEVSIYSIAGKLLNTYNLEDTKIELNLADLSSGFYFIKINNLITRKFVIH